MSAFNTVKVVMKCGCCEHAVNRRVQFRYGDTWQHEYELGDHLRWGGNDVGMPGAECISPAVEGPAYFVRDEFVDQLVEVTVRGMIS